MKKRLSAFFVPQDNLEILEKSTIEPSPAALLTPPVLFMDKDTVTISILKACLEVMSKEIKNELNDKFTEIESDLVLIGERILKLEDKDQEREEQLIKIIESQDKVKTNTE
ncbi:Hypothetical predicted protein [Pelobates cultripes]|uniref:Uncharacterized protein n=1 Tax=Pelobates cultripes TaxID=61616 RepID=A0AAD1SGG1_PELCU|nr:Hypothetical predicted protein [Pelobates cultripes]